MASSSTRKSARSLPPDHYLLRSQQPLPSLLFLLPLIALYEIGTFVYRNELAAAPLTARTWVHSFFQWTLDLFGALGPAEEHLPALAVIVVLLSLHLVQSGPWRFEPRLYLAMGFESVAVAIPLLLVGLLSGSRSGSIVLAAGSVTGSWQADMILSIGAGIYEELVFRLVTIALVHMVLVDMLRMSDRRGAAAAIIVSTVFFTWSHFSPANPVTLEAVAFYSFAGLYFAVVYITRGFGIVVAVHALYDIFIFAILHGLLPQR